MAIPFVWREEQYTANRQVTRNLSSSSKVKFISILSRQPPSELSLLSSLIQQTPQNQFTSHPELTIIQHQTGFYLQQNTLQQDKGLLQICLALSDILIFYLRPGSLQDHLFLNSLNTLFQNSQQTQIQPKKLVFLVLQQDEQVYNNILRKVREQWTKLYSFEILKKIFDMKVFTIKFDQQVQQFTKNSLKPLVKFIQNTHPQNPLYFSQKLLQNTLISLNQQKNTPISLVVSQTYSQILEPPRTVFIQNCQKILNDLDQILTYKPILDKYEQFYKQNLMSMQLPKPLIRHYLDQIQQKHHQIVQKCSQGILDHLQCEIHYYYYKLQTSALLNTMLQKYIFKRQLRKLKATLRQNFAQTGANQFITARIEWKRHHFVKQLKKRLLRSIGVQFVVGTMASAFGGLALRGLVGAAVFV